MGSGSGWRRKAERKFWAEEGKKAEKGLSSRNDQRPNVNGHKERKYYTLKKYGLQKTERLKKQNEIRRLFSKGSRFSHGNLVIIYRPGEDRKVGFVASKEIGGAVKRNRIRRILREAYRMNKDIFKGLNVIFYARGHCDLDTVQNILTLFKEQRWKQSL